MLAIPTKTRPGGTDTQPQFNNAGAFAGMSGITWVAGTSTYTFGSGVVVNFAGATSGNTRLRAPAVAVTGDVFLPAVAGTLATLGLNNFTDSQTINSGTKTAIAPIIDGTQTWNNSAIAFIGLKLSVVDTASASSSKPFAVYAGAAGTTEILSITKTGLLTTAVGANFGDNLSTVGTQIAISNAAGRLVLGVGGDAILSRGGVATLQLGAADAAAPVAQTLRTQGSRAGTDPNVGGANFTQQPGTGTGTGTLSSILFRTPVLGVSGTAAQVQTTTLTLTGGLATFAGKVTAAAGGVRTIPVTVGTLPDAAASGDGTRNFVSDASMTSALGIGTVVVGGGTNKVGVIVSDNLWKYG